MVAVAGLCGGDLGGRGSGPGLELPQEDELDDDGDPGSEGRGVGSDTGLGGIGEGSFHLCDWLDELLMILDSNILL